MNVVVTATATTTATGGSALKIKRLRQTRDRAAYITTSEVVIPYQTEGIMTKTEIELRIIVG